MGLHFVITFIKQASPMLALISGIYYILIGPVLYNYFLIPRIEARVNQKIRFSGPIYKLIPGANWTHKQIDVGYGIFLKSLGSDSIGKFGKSNVVKKINYKPDNAPKMEIIISWLTIFSYAILLLLIFVILSFI